MTTIAHTRKMIDRPLRNGEPEIWSPMVADAADPAGSEALEGASIVLTDLAGSEPMVRGPVSIGALAPGATATFAGRTRSEIGAHAVRPGTSSSAESVTSHTRCRAPADVLCIPNVMPSATSRIRVALSSSRTIDTLGPAMTDARPEKNVVLIAIISRSGARAEYCCEGA